MWRYREVLSRIRGGGSEGYVGRSVQGGPGNHRFCGLYQEDGETGQGAGPNHVFYRPYHLISLETPISVARAAIYGEPTIEPRGIPTAEVVAVAKRDISGGERLGDIGSADYYGRVYSVSETTGMLPLGLAAGARTTRPVSRGEVIPRTGVEVAEDSLVAGLRRLQETILRGTNG